MDELDKIIRKIQDLMKLAQDNPNDEEGQTALLMAQRLLLKYNLSMETVQDRSNKDKDVIKESEVSAAAINEYIECSQVTYQDGELVIDIKDTDILLELEGEKFVNIVTEYVSPVEIMNAMKIHNISARHPAYEKLAAQLEEIKRLAIRLADLEGDERNA